MPYLKPQNPIKLGEDYIYPLTTSDQVILNNGNRLNSLFKKTIRENITLLSSDWSEVIPYTQTITLNESTDDYNVDANVIYGGDNDVALNKAASCISYIKKNHKEITFYCLKKKPEIDIPAEITGTCRNTIATIEEGIKLNFDVVAYGSEEELLADTPAENTIGIITDTPITGYRFSATEPENMNEGEVWILTGDGSSVPFNSLKISDAYINMVYPLNAKQYINGVLTNVTAKSYQNGDWIDWWNKLYSYGDECIKITGGWTHYVSFGTATSTKKADSIYVTCTEGTSGAAIDIRHINKINLTHRSKAILTFSSTRIHPTDAALVARDASGAWIASKALSKTGTNIVVELDISNISGEGYISVFTTTYSGNTNLTIHELLVE